MATTETDDMLSRMGVTIHFEGQLNNEAAYQELIGVASQRPMQKAGRSSQFRLAK
jgi:hypothetical protein